MTHAVGSTVRIRGSAGKKHPFTCRAIIATISSGEKSVSLVRDDLAPVPLGRVGNFIVAPLFNSVGRSVEECESSIDDLMELLPFEDSEIIADSESLSTAEKVELYKSRGDQLLRLNDYTCATAYYEAALNFIASKSNVSIGGSCIARRNGDAVIADVDCIDTDQYDVTFISQEGEEEEATIPQKDILCSICFKDDAYMQPRCLLNLSRCLVKLAEIDPTSGNVGCAGQSKRATRQEKYRSSAVLACSITITLCEYLKKSKASPDVPLLLDSLIGKARLIRSRSFIGRNMLRNAMVDAKKIISQNPHDKDALKLISEIKAKDAHNKSLDRKISKEVCRWVKKATTTSEGAAAIERMDEESSVSDSETHLSETEYMRSLFVWIFQKTFMEIGAVIAFLIAMWVIY